jgi:hypothetical protein
VVSRDGAASPGAAALSSNNINRNFSSLAYAWENCVPLSRTYQHDHFTFNQTVRSTMFWLNMFRLISWWALSLLFATLVLY